MLAMRWKLIAPEDNRVSAPMDIASLIETCKLNGVDPQAYLTRALTAIMNGCKHSRIDELMPWNYSCPQTAKV